MANESRYYGLLTSLGTAIAAGDHPPGTVLRTEELAEQHQVSRTIAREVVRVLESMRLVETRRRVGVTVRPRSDWNLYDPLVIRWRLAGADRDHQLRTLSELRSAVEPVAAGFAARHATAEQSGELTGLAVRLAVTARSGDLVEFLHHDIAFHRTVLVASGNEMFGQLGDVVAEVLTGRTEHHLMPAHPDPDAVRLHTEVAEAIGCREPDRAERAMREIVVQAMNEMGHLRV